MYQAEDWVCFFHLGEDIKENSNNSLSVTSNVFGKTLSFSTSTIFGSNIYRDILENPQKFFQSLINKELKIEEVDNSLWKKLSTQYRINSENTDNKDKQYITNTPVMNKNECKNNLSGSINDDKSIFSHTQRELKDVSEKIQEKANVLIQEDSSIDMENELVYSESPYYSTIDESKYETVEEFLYNEMQKQQLTISELSKLSKVEYQVIFDTLKRKTKNYCIQIPEAIKICRALSINLNDFQDFYIKKTVEKEKKKFNEAFKELVNEDMDLAS